MGSALSIVGTVYFTVWILVVCVLIGLQVTGSSIPEIIRYAVILGGLVGFLSGFVIISKLFKNRRAGKAV